MQDLVGAVKVRCSGPSPRPAHLGEKNVPQHLLRFSLAVEVFTLAIIVKIHVTMLILTLHFMIAQTCLTCLRGIMKCAVNKI